MNSLTVQEKILVHLSKYRAYRGKIAVPTAITQEGIAETIGVKRPHISVEIKRMMKKGLVEEFKAHAGGRKRRKAYFTTPEGERRVKEIEEIVRTRNVIVRANGDSREMRGDEAVAYISSSMSIPYCMAVDAVMGSSVISPIDIKETVERKRRAAYSSPIPRVSELFGRDAETKSIEEWYRGKTTTLAVIGTAGIGKTSLVAAFVSSLRSPVFWYRIEKWETVKGVLSSLSEFLARNGKTSLKKYLSGREVDMGIVAKILQNIDEKQIWVFDDYQNSSEDVKDIFGMLHAVLKKTPVRLIVISRAIPDFYTRREVSLKGDIHEIFLDGISPEAARAFLISKGMFTNEEDFQEIYSFSKGHPLTIEMGGLAGLKKGAVTAYLSEEFYSRLKADERRILSKISVYRRPVPAEAFVTTERDIETLKSLVRKGIVHYNTEERYFTHDIIRELFGKKRDQKKDHLMAFRYLSGSDILADKLEAIYHLLEAKEYDTLDEYLLIILDEVISKGMGRELLTLIGPEMSERPGMLISKGVALHATGRLEDAENILQKAIEISEGENRILGMNALAMVYNATDKQKEAETILREAMEECSGGSLMAELKNSMGVVFIRTYRYDDAERSIREAISIHEKKGNLSRKAHAEGSLATVLARKGDLEGAVEALRKQIEFFQEVREYRVLGNLYHNLAIFEAGLGRREEANRHFERAMVYAEISSHAQLMGYAMTNMADNYLKMGKVDEAKKLSEKAEKILTEIGDRRMLAILKTVIAGIHDTMGNNAEPYYEDAERVLREQGQMRQLGEMYEERAERCPDILRKKEFYTKAIEIFREIGDGAGIKRVEEKMNEDLAGNR